METVTLNNVPRIETLADLKRVSGMLGGFFFTPGAMAYFRSRVSSRIYATSPTSGYFVTSEQFVSMNGDAEPRSYTVRGYEVTTHNDGSPWLNIWTVGEFEQFATSRAAHKAAASLIGNYRF